MAGVRGGLKMGSLKGVWAEAIRGWGVGVVDGGDLHEPRPTLVSLSSSLDPFSLGERLYAIHYF